jgi:glyoxylate utilization-related uncharacterized protein
MGSAEVVDGGATAAALKPNSWAYLPAGRPARLVSAEGCSFVAFERRYALAVRARA